VSTAGIAGPQSDQRGFVQSDSDCGGGWLRWSLVGLTRKVRPGATIGCLWKVCWVVRTGSPWRDLPEAFGDWNSVFRRFSRWSIKGVWWRIFEAMSDDPDFEYLIVDSTIVRAHQHAAGAKKGGLKIRRSAARAAA
jgi:transposase